MERSPRFASCIPRSRASAYGSRRDARRPRRGHVDKNPKVELFYQIGADMVHLTVTGKAKFVEDITEKKRIWNGKVFDYDLSQFWPGGRGVERLRPDAYHARSRRADVAAGNDDRQEAGSLARLAQVEVLREAYPRTRSRAKMARSSAVIFSRMREPLPRCRYSPPSEKYSSYGCGGIGSGRRRVCDLHAQHVLDELRVVHPDSVVIRQ